MQVQNNTINGKCSNCGECCTEYIPLTANEVSTIRIYLKNHPEIKEQEHVYGNTIHVLCPFRDQVQKRCNIYPVRPAICRLFVCNQTEDILKKNRAMCIAAALYNNFNSTSIVTLHTLFFGNIQWELKVLRGTIEPIDETDFIKKLIALNPMIVDQKFITFK